MILYKWRGPDRNFGDELNTLLWPRLLPEFFDGNETARFLGIGSILDGRHDPAAIKLVAGAGYGGYEAPIRLDATWIVHWVRGRRTARSLDLPLSLGLGDPASLIPLTGVVPRSVPTDIGFIPHFESASRGAWREAAAMAGLVLIDPRDDPHSVLTAISRCRLILCEALHGAIVADALRVPWIAIEPLAPIHRPKWLDWAETLGLTLEFQRLPPSSLLEQAHLSRLSRFHAGRLALTRIALAQIALARQAPRLLAIARQRYVRRAAEALCAAARAKPRLSTDAALERGQTRMMDAVAILRREPMGGWSRFNVTRQPASPSQMPLQARDVSAYHDTPGRLIA